MPPMDPPKQAILLPNTQSMYCQYHNFCRGGIAAYQLARGPARNLWIPLCQKCAEEMFRGAPDRLIRVCVEGAIERGLSRMVELGMGAPAVMRTGALTAEELAELGSAPGVVVASPDPMPVSRSAVLDHLRAYADDPGLIAALADLFGDGESQEPQDDPAPPEQAQSAPAPAKAEKPAAKPLAKGGAQKPAKKPGRK